VTLLTRALGLVVTLALMGALVWASSAPITAHGSHDAVLRVAWSARPERIEKCRERTEEELAKLPQHMRQRLLCEGVSAQYRLTVLYNGTLVSEQLLHGGGLRQDRRLYVFNEVRLTAGDALLEVRFDLQGDQTPAAEKSKTRGETVPPHLSLEQRVRVRPREVILVTYSPERRALVAVQDAVQVQ
jgi:hypothetical protein